MTGEELAKNEILLVLLFQASRHSEADNQRVQQAILSGSVGSSNLLLVEFKQLRTLKETIGFNVKRLQSVLGSSHLDAMHVVFVAQGAGSPIVKSFLSEAMKRTLEFQTNNSSAEPIDHRDISFRARRVICMGSLLAYQKAPGFFANLAGRFDRSVRAIDSQSQERCIEIDKTLSSLLRDYSDRGWPYPQLKELLLQEEFSNEGPDNDDGLQRIYGEYCDRHLVSDLTAWPNDPVQLFSQQSIKTNISQEIEVLIRAFNLPLTRKIVTSFFDRPDLVDLISDLAENDETASHQPMKSSGGAQKTVFAEIYRESVGKKRQHHQNISIIVSGHAGLGKSTLLRRLAQVSAFNFYLHPSPRIPAPIFLNMPTVSIETVSIGGPAGDDFLAQLILDKLLDVVGQNFVEHSEETLRTRESIQRALTKQATLLIIDGIDEFLINAPDIRLLHFRMAVEKLLATSSEADFRMVIGIRNSVRNFGQLASSPDKVFMLSELSTEQAVRYFGESSNRIGAIEQADLRAAFLTPLILSAFSESNVLVQSSISTISGLWELALRSILSKSGISKLTNAHGRATSLDDWIGALSIAAAVFHMTMRFEFSISELRNQIELMRMRWKKFTSIHGDLSAREMDPGVGFELLDNERTLKALIERTVFTVTSQNMVQFNHRQWRDYLTGRYTALCIEIGNVDEIGEMAFNVQIYRTAGELLSRQAIDEDLISRAIKRTIETKNEFVIGNLGALIGNATAPMTRPAIVRLFQLMPNYTPLVQTVIVGSVGRRGLETSDGSSIDIRKGIDRTLRQFAMQIEGSRYNVLLESLSWCFLKAYHKRFNAPAPPENFAPFSFDTGSDDARVIVCMKNDDWTYDNKFGSVQNTFSMIQETVLVDRVTRPISVVHYLACILAARTAGAHIPEAAEELSTVLLPGSQFETAFRNFEDVPEVYDLYRRCQEEYRRFVDG